VVVRSKGVCDPLPRNADGALEASAGVCDSQDLKREESVPARALRALSRWPLGIYFKSEYSGWGEAGWPERREFDVTSHYILLSASFITRRPPIGAITSVNGCNYIPSM
jgi:hypothetical protein